MTDQYQNYCFSVLNLDKSIRFVGKIVNKILVSHVWHKDVVHLLDEEQTNMAHHQVSIKAMMDAMLDDKLGKVKWKITTREKVIMITIFQKDGILIFSKDPDGDNEKIIQKIQKL